MSTPVRYQDPGQPVEARAADLLGQMTRQEKLAQLGSVWVFQLLAEGRFSPERAEPILHHGLGQITRVAGATSVTPGEAAKIANDIQRHLVEQTRLGIPAIVHEEVCSGVMARGTTIFPQAIGVASTWDPELNRRLADVVRTQMRAMGAHQGLSPVLDVCRDPRWGRTEETYGEDPHLVAAFGVAFVRGLQGDDLTSGVLATAKHFVGYGASEGGLNWAPAHLPPRELREVYLHPFEAAVREAGLASVMNGYHELDGVPCGADAELLTGLLRHEWGFDGTVVSDYFSVDQLASYHRLAHDKRAAAAMALTAGIDVELPGTDCYGAPLDTALDAGDVDGATLDAAVERVLRQKFALGLFESPYVDPGRIEVTVATPGQHDLALEIARGSLVLLKNQTGLLPLGDHGTIALIGPSADDARNLLGDYSHAAHMETLAEARDQDSLLGGMPTIPDDLTIQAATEHLPTILGELRARLGDRVRHARGCGILDPSKNEFEAAVAAAADADAVVLVVGDRAGLTDDCTSGEARDRSSLDLPGVQEDLARAMAATGTPMVAVLVAGRPIGSTWLHEHCEAVLLAWLPGQAGATAIAEALMGEASPGGKLPMSYPRSAGHVPVFYGHKASGGRSHWKGDYVDAPVGPRYPFGHGLSYTTFSLDAATAGPEVVAAEGEIEAVVTVTNRGERAGDEVVQIYVRDPAASVTRPVLELKGFARIRAEPGETRTITFRVPAGMLGFHGRGLTYVLEPGEIEVLVGFDAAHTVPAGTLVVDVADGARIAKRFLSSVTID